MAAHAGSGRGLRSRSHAVRCGGAVVVALGAAAPAAVAQSFEVVTGTGFTVRGISGDGAVRVGTTGPWLHETAVRWPTGGALENLPVLPNGDSAVAYGTNADGSVVVGQCYLGFGLYRAAKWTATGGVVGLPYLSGNPVAEIDSATAVSSNGSVIVGWSGRAGQQRACRWVGNALMSLGTLSGGNWSQAGGVSGDGTVIVGLSDTSNGTRGFRWTSTTGMVDLGLLPAMTTSNAVAISENGVVIVGYCSVSSRGRAFRWRAPAGMVSLAPLAGSTGSIAFGVSGNGSVVVGYSSDQQGNLRACLWNAMGEVVELEALLASLGVDTMGWHLSRANAISSDGRTIVGWCESASGQPATWMATIPAVCPADFDGDGHLFPADVSGFVASWFTALTQGSLAADFDGNGVIEPADVAAFVGAWFSALISGC